VPLSARAAAIGWVLCAACGRAPEPPTATPPASTAPQASVPVPSSPPSEAASEAWKAGAKRLTVWEPLPDVVPPTQDPPAGPRAPTTALLGARVGFSTFAEVQAWTLSRGHACANKSVRATIQGMRDAKVRELSAARAQGKPVDTVTGASIVVWRSNRETNPQVRWACDRLDPAALGDRPRPSVPQARLLYIFDSPTLPLRDVSLQRSYPKDREADALEDLRATLAALTVAFGPPNDGAAEVPDGKAPVPPMRSLKWAWSWSDAFLKLQVVNFPNGMTLTEEIGILPSIRADAPALAHKGTP